MFWEHCPDSINCPVELTEQKGVKDSWYNEVLMQCRSGELTVDAYQYLLGLATACVVAGGMMVAAARLVHTCTRSGKIWPDTAHPGRR